ncbi:hypothetical protein ACFCZQ_33190 [Streptomyces virginiae]|uniref:hypothetical protein n=1 Tax=Streptomyces virginiae TaxID=1961 RepID=UPI0035D93F7B
MRWYRMAAEAADASNDLDTLVWVHGRAAIALGHEGAVLPTADVFTGRAIAICDRPGGDRSDAWR